jgi:hypothetical protein
VGSLRDSPSLFTITAMNFCIAIWTEDNDWDFLDFFYTREEADMYLPSYQNLYEGMLVSVFAKAK